MDFPGGSAVKESASPGRPGFDLWFGEIPWRREWLPAPVFWPGEFYRLYSPWVTKTQLSHFHFLLTLITNERDVCLFLSKEKLNLMKIRYRKSLHNYKIILRTH